MGAKVTIKTVAEHAGVSTATVSRTLNGNQNVSPELQASVTRAAEKLGYSLNAVAIALRSSRTNTVGMVVPEIDNPFISRLIQEVEYVLGSMGIQLMLCSSQQDGRRELSALKGLVARRVDGLVVVAPDTPAERFVPNRIPQSIPTIYVTPKGSKFGIHSQGCVDEPALRRIRDHLISLPA